MIIRIEESSNEEGYVYDLYKDDEAFEENNSFDGGLCTGSFDDALEMATSQAMERVKATTEEEIQKLAYWLANKATDEWQLMVGDEAMDGDQTEKCSQYFLIQLNKMMGNN